MSRWLRPVPEGSDGLRLRVGTAKASTLRRLDERSSLGLLDGCTTGRWDVGSTPLRGRFRLSTSGELNDGCTTRPNLALRLRGEMAPGKGKETGLDGGAGAAMGMEMNYFYRPAVVSLVSTWWR